MAATTPAKQALTASSASLEQQEVGSWGARSPLPVEVDHAGAQKVQRMAQRVGPPHVAIGEVWRRPPRRSHKRRSRRADLHTLGAPGTVYLDRVCYAPPRNRYARVCSRFAEFLSHLICLKLLPLIVLVAG